MKGNPKVAVMESESVRWVRYCSVNDVNWASAVKRLTDAELGYCLRWETRATGLQKLQVEAKRRGVGTLYLQCLAEKIEPEGNELHVGFQEPPVPPGERPEQFDDPFIGAAGPGKYFLTMRSSRKGRRCISRSFSSEEEAMARAEQLMGTQVIDIEPEDDGMAKSALDHERDVTKEAYQLGRKESDQALALLESTQFDYEALGKIKAANFNTKANELLKYVTLHQVKQRKEYKKAGWTWEEFCRAIGESVRSVDHVLGELSPVLDGISANLAEILGMPLSKIRYLGRAVSANLAEITDNAIVIDDQRIEIIPENKDDIEAAIDLMKEAREKERQAHAKALEQKEKSIERLEKRLTAAVSEETKALEAERNDLIAELAKFKKFDPAGKDVSWSIEQMQEIEKACMGFFAVCEAFMLDERLDEHIELQAKVEECMTRVELRFGDLRRIWVDRFYRSAD